MNFDFASNNILAYKKVSSGIIPTCSKSLNTNIARTLEEIPELQDGNVRLVHITDAGAAESIVNNGLDYRSYGRVNYTARVYDDRVRAANFYKEPFTQTLNGRLAKPEQKVIIMDLPKQEYYDHTVPERAKERGLVPAQYVVGCIPNVLGQEDPDYFNKIRVKSN